MRFNSDGVDLSFEGVEVERFDGGLDWRRVIVEMTKQAFPRSSVKYRRLDDVVVAIDRDLGEVASVPIWRVACFDDERLNPFVYETLDRLPNADDIIAELAVHAIDVIDEPSSNYVLLHVNGFKLAAIHRGMLVEGWPTDEDGGFCD